MRRHLAAVALASALREIVYRELARCDPAPEHERAIAIIPRDVIPVAQLHAERGERLVAHAADVEMSLALAIQILLTEIAMPTLENNREEAKLILFAERWHTAAPIL